MTGNRTNWSRLNPEELWKRLQDASRGSYAAFQATRNLCFPNLLPVKVHWNSSQTVTSHPWTRSRSMYSQFCALTSHSLQNNNGSPYGCSVYAEIDVRQYNVAIKVRSAMLVCLHLATTIPCAQVVWRDVPGMLKSRESWFEVVTFGLKSLPGTQHYRCCHSCHSNDTH